MSEYLNETVHNLPKRLRDYEQTRIDWDEEEVEAQEELEQDEQEPEQDEYETDEVSEAGVDATA
jgi:hypothetical protein